MKTHLYRKDSAFEVPDSVAIVTRTVNGEPGRGGTVTLQEVWVGQMVCVGCPSKRARTSPFGLNRLVP